MMREGPPETRLDLGAEPDDSTLRVLVVESRGHTSALLQEAAAHTGIAVELVREPRAAARQLRRGPYDAVVIDLPAPGIEAEDLYREIVATDLTLARRVVFLVNDLGDPQTRRFLGDVGLPFLTQPADPLELCDLLWRVAARDSSGWDEHGAG